MNEDYDGVDDVLGSDTGYETYELRESRLYYFELAQRMTGSTDITVIMTAAEQIEEWFGDADYDTKAAAVEQMLSLRGAADPVDILDAADELIVWLRR